LNLNIIEAEGLIERYEASEGIAFNFAKHHGIPAVSALKLQGKHSQDFHHQVFLIYPWIDGSLLETKQIKLHHVQIIGEIMASMHQAKLATIRPQQPHYWRFSEEHWLSLFTQYSKTALVNHQDYLKLLPDILHWDQQYLQSIDKLNENLVISHGDLHDQKCPLG